MSVAAIIPVGRGSAFFFGWLSPALLIAIYSPSYLEGGFSEVHGLRDECTSAFLPTAQLP